MAEKLLRDIDSVYVAGPYSSDPLPCTERAIDVGDEVRDLGFYPFIPHLFHYWHERHERTYDDWLDLDFYHLDNQQCLLALDGESSGTDQEWKRAAAHGKMCFLGIESFKQRLKDEALIVCLVGPSGVGKTTMAHQLDDQVSISEAISHTSRDIRNGEKEGVHYYYRSLKEMNQMLDNGEFIEYTNYSGNIYGLAQDSIEDIMLDREDVVVVVDKVGLGQLRELYPSQVVGIHLLPPDLYELDNRMKKQGRSERERDQRLVIAKQEIRDTEGWDYTVQNNTIEHTLNNLKAIYDFERRKRNDVLRRQVDVPPYRRIAQERPSRM